MKTFYFLFALLLFVSCRQKPIVFTANDGSEFTVTTEESTTIRAETFLDQPQPNLEIRFANPKLVVDKYVVDVEMKCDSPNTELFGMNVRFFYDRLDFNATVKLINFQGGYGLHTWPQPQVYVGNIYSKVMFATAGAACFVNGNMQIVDKSKPKILLNNWAKVFEIELTPTIPITTFDNFCPELIWDKMPNPLLGSYFIGSDGVTALVLAKSGKYETHPTIERPTQYNWNATVTVKFKYPYGSYKCMQ